MAGECSRGRPRVDASDVPKRLEIPREGEVEQDKWQAIPQSYPLLHTTIMLARITVNSARRLPRVAPAVQRFYSEDAFQYVHAGIFDLQKWNL